MWSGDDSLRSEVERAIEVLEAGARETRKSAARPKPAARLTRDTAENYVRGLSGEELGEIWIKLEKSVRDGRLSSSYLTRWDASPGAALAGVPYDVARDYGLPVVERLHKSEAVADGLPREEIQARLLQAMQAGALSPGILSVFDVDHYAALRRVPQGVAQQFGIPIVG